MSSHLASAAAAFGFPIPGRQSPTSMDVSNDVFFVSSAAWDSKVKDQQFDYIVIGSGFCALAFIDRVLRHDSSRRVLILERGSLLLPDHFQNLPGVFRRTLGGAVETYPWTLSTATAAQPKGSFQWAHGMVPFFGGRSILWSGWCPRPQPHEMPSWPSVLIDAANRNFDAAERLLNVVPADRIDAHLELEFLRTVAKLRPVYSTLQIALQRAIHQRLRLVPGATRSIPAPIAIGASITEGLGVGKFSTPAPLLQLLGQTASTPSRQVQCATDCTVSRIVQRRGKAEALETSRGRVNVGSAKVILAMGSIPPATLLLNSYPGLQRVGTRITAHFVTSAVARLPKSALIFGGPLLPMELAAVYVAGVTPRGRHYHVQLSAFLGDSGVNAEKFVQCAPDVVASASPEQLATSPGHVVLVAAVLGELDHENSNNSLVRNDSAETTSNVTLQILPNDCDSETWDFMDHAAFELLERGVHDGGRSLVEYWHGSSRDGTWACDRPSREQRRSPGLVHEGSPLWMDVDQNNGVVGHDYRPHGVENVYVTGASLWPRSGSWNPTLTMVALAQDLGDRLEVGESGTNGGGRDAEPAGSRPGEALR